MELADTVEWVSAQDDAALLARLAAVEEERRRVEAETAVLLAELDERRAYRADEHATMWGLLRSRLHWSDRECRERMRVARLARRFVDAAECLFDGRASVANIAEIGRGSANPRIGDRIESDIGPMLTAACRDEFADVKALMVRWEQITDVDAAHDAAERADESRSASFRIGPDGGDLAASWGPLGSLENREIFDHFVQTEWDADWEATLAEHGDGAAPHLMPRTAAQRRADALTTILRTAATAVRPAGTPTSEVVIHVDHHTMTDILALFGVFPERRRDPFDDPVALITRRRCETTDGDPIDPITAVQTALDGHVRFAIADEQGVPIVWGRKRRLFTGQARRAVCRCRADVPIPAVGHRPGAAKSTTPSTGPTVAAPTPPTAHHAVDVTTTPRTTATPPAETRPAAGAPTAPTAPRSADGHVTIDAPGAGAQRQTRAVWPSKS